MIVILIVILLAIGILWPRVDYYKDYRDHKHLVIWYNWFDDRRFFHYEWVAK